ncbi:MAG: septal ring lytic transglycosylase RlpA family protein [Holosporales bacterium]|nr:septal ring lytic transglycosylase RlpA family protein [Holosporales bacterium]
MAFLGGLLGIFPILVSAEEKVPTSTQSPKSLKNKPYKSQVGIASWYGSRDRGKLTASGIRFSPDALVAAHSTLPLPTIVRVTNLSNGRSAEVFVIDRLPRKWGRAIDLSREVAQRLGFLHRGLTRVRIEVIAHPHMQFVRTSLREPLPKKSKKALVPAKKQVRRATRRMKV